MFAKSPEMVSVLVTVFNRARYLAACLDSILASSHGDFEIVVVDDTSSDGSVEIAEDYARRDSRIRFFRNEKNLGDYPNRMRAAELATGKYLKYVDSDDLIYPHSLGVMVQAMEKYPDACLGLSHSQPEDEEPYPWKLGSEAAWDKHFLGRGCLSCGPSGAIIHRERFFEAGGFRNWGVLNDSDMWYRMSAKWPVVLLPPGLVWWRRHEGQEFTRNGAAAVYLERGFKLGMETLKSPDCPLNPARREQALLKLRQHHARRLWALGGRGHGAGAWWLYRRSGLSVGEFLSGLRPYRS